MCEAHIEAHTHKRRRCQQILQSIPSPQQTFAPSDIVHSATILQLCDRSEAQRMPLGRLQRCLQVLCYSVRAH